ncbi:hypothetical protein A3B84_00905 [Candidatus Nomurabacteria bacterium RIFCSPHIGHO2_02_FULL_35_13]|uniref:Cytidyltransferase-like domain-containing protein n=2 Tax=Candidatus Nomuraibacteriota TaxID=1752729 RepID=A0A1F6VPG8_9BACT|nr:MAG: Glycerol-3-phosphate cytidylyltransferase [Candidatus Nomurabacteria bacterium GW2011_GWA1_35_8]OGI71528.1 MAG: hypothetical protein A3B84_00905 [Candidatus Nomurabacteria bacterium RIFCSPHIGHO2_02_FULL_35_13]
MKNKNNPTTRAKLSTGRGKQKRVVMVSGGFDPIHIGHVRMFEEAKKLGDELVVVINNDNWLKLKKGYAFMPERERKEIIEAFKAVDRVVLSGHKKNTKDISISKELRAVRPHIFAKGGDRHCGNIPTPEVLVCNEIGCKIVNDIGFGGKVQSSSKLLKEYSKKIKK